MAEHEMAPPSPILFANNPQGSPILGAFSAMRAHLQCVCVNLEPENEDKTLYT